MRFIAIILWALFVVLCVIFPPLGIAALLYSSWQTDKNIQILANKIQDLEERIETLEYRGRRGDI